MAKSSLIPKVIIVVSVIAIGVMLLIGNDEDNGKESNTEENQEILKLSEKEIIQKELDFIANGLDFTEFKTSVIDLQREVTLFKMWGSKIQDAKNSGDEEAIKLALELEKKVKNIQTSEFPKIRKAYIDEIAKKMWLEDIVVKGSGNSYSIINFTGALFVKNKSIQTVNDAALPALKEFRFSQSRYRWYKEDSEYTYYTIFEGKDSDLVL
jgi:hypothetical protein